MIDIYEQFIETKEIGKDINFFYNKIKDKILTDIFPKYLCDKRRKKNRNYSIENLFSKFGKTALKFNSDIINFSFIVDDTDQSQIEIEKLEYYNFKLNVVINIKIVLKISEKKNRMIYEDNKLFHRLQKTISELKDFHRKCLLKDEIENNPHLNEKLKQFLNIHNTNFIESLINSTNPDFKQKLENLKPIIRGIKTSVLSDLFMIIHKTNFYNEYKKQIKLNRIVKHFLDMENSEEILNDLAQCFNHQIKPKKNKKFLEDIITHYNQANFRRTVDIDKFISENFKFN